jgi:hypothetical protein
MLKIYTVCLDNQNDALKTNVEKEICMHYRRKSKLMFSKTHVKFISSKNVRNYVAQPDDFLHQYYDTVDGTGGIDGSLRC